MAGRAGSNAALRKLAEGTNVATRPDPLVLALGYVEVVATVGHRWTT